MLARAGRAVAIVFLLWLAGLALAGLGILPAGDLPLGPVLVQQSPPPLRARVKPAPPSRADLLPARPATLTASALLRGSSPRRGSLASAAGSRSQSPSVTATGGALGAHRGSRLPGSRTSGSGHRPPPAAVAAPGAVTATPGSTTATPGGAAGTSGLAPVGTSTTPSTATGTGKDTAHGTTTAPGQTRLQSTPGHTTATAPGSSASAPGQVKQTTTTMTASTTSTSPGQSGSAPGQTVTHGSVHGNHG